MKLYGRGESRSFRALWALEESGLDYEYQDVKIGSSEDNGTQTAAYKTLNIQGKVPSLALDNGVVNESLAIINYIASRVPEKALMPSEDSQERALYDEVCSFIVTDLEQGLWNYGKHSFVLPKDLRIKAMLDVGRWEFDKSIKALKAYCNENTEYLIGNRFTMADVLLAHTIQWAERFKFDVPDVYLAYRDKHYQRAACQRALKLI